MRALDLFRGAGGWSVACQHLGIEDHGVEIMPQANATALAAGHSSAFRDVWEPPPLVGFDGEIASPPCPTFSVAGKGTGRAALDSVLAAIRARAYLNLESLRAYPVADDDDRTRLVLTPLHYAYALRPEWIAWEQVPTVLPVWERCAEELRGWGYSVWTGNLQAEQYGVPQTRKRAILIASRNKEVGMPEPTHSKYYPRSPEKLDPDVKKWISMAEALGWDAHGYMRSNYGTGGDPHNRGERGLSEPAATVTSHVNRNFWRFAGAGATSEFTAGQIPRGLDEPAHTVTGKGTAAWVLRNNSSANAAERSPDEPAPTLYFGQRSNYCAWEWRGEGHARNLPDWAYNRPSTTIVGTFKPEVVAAPGYRTTVSRQNAPDSVRVTVQEAGILQSFPADYPWQGAKTKQYLQVGNAIPPLLAEAILSEATS